MQFFIPDAIDQAEEQAVYRSMKQFLSDQSDAQFSDRQIFRLQYHDDGVDYEAEVGRPHVLNGEPVITILYEPSRDIYHVASENRHVLRWTSMLVGGHSVRSVVDFEGGCA